MRNISLKLLSRTFSGCGLKMFLFLATEETFLGAHWFEFRREQYFFFYIFLFVIFPANLKTMYKQNTMQFTCYEHFH